mgnify:CR=1 FL=1|tara:strand:- start:476 stop:676 length:201 start_codon:yes stop_codon:yes gene_type:complete
MNPLDKIIQMIRESMVANAPGTGGGFSNSSDSAGPTAGYDAPLSTLKVFKRNRYIYQKNTRKNWKK